MATLLALLFGLVLGLLVGGFGGIILYTTGILNSANIRDMMEKEAFDSRQMVEIKESEEL